MQKKFCFKPRRIKSQTKFSTERNGFSGALYLEILGTAYQEFNLKIVKISKKHVKNY